MAFFIIKDPLISALPWWTIQSMKYRVNLFLYITFKSFQSHLEAKYNHFQEAYIENHLILKWDKTCKQVSFLFATNKVDH